MNFLFTLNYQIPRGADTGALVESLGSAGCADAIIGMGQAGYMALEFSRESDCLHSALTSALAAVAAAVPMAILVAFCSPRGPGNNLEKTSERASAFRKFTIEDIREINQRVIDGRHQPLSETSRRILRHVRFSRVEINAAFAAARKKLWGARV